MTAGSTQKAEYRGAFDLGDLGKEGRVKISIVEGDGPGRHAKFEAKGLPVICGQEGIRETRNYTSRVPFVNRKMFYSDSFFESVSDSIVLYVIRGKLRQQGRVASGYVRVSEIRPDPGSGDPDAGPDCTTLGARQAWKAERV